MGRFKGGCVSATDKGRVGVFRLDEVVDEIRANTWLKLPGQAEWLTPGTYTWVCPVGVTSVSAVCVGAGGGGYSSWSNAGGGGGGLGWKNAIQVSPGQTYTVVVGARGGTNGAANGWSGGNSYFINLSTVSGYGGGNTSAGIYTNGPNQNGSGGGWVGDGGGAGGSGTNYTGGGGAGGYTGNGGNSNNNAPAGSGGGAGGGYYSSTYGTGAGGGTGIYGQRTDYDAMTKVGYSSNGSSGPNQGAAYIYGNQQNGLGGEGGSTRTSPISGQKTGHPGHPGENGVGQTYYGTQTNGGFPGGGGGGSGTSNGGGYGADGAVRLIWAGDATGTRAFPSTNTEDI